MSETHNNTQITKIHQQQKSPTKKVPEKITIQLRPGPGAPPLKTTKFKLKNELNVSWLIGKLRGMLGASENESVFLYLAQSFAPLPTQSIGELWELFQADDKVIFHYTKQPAFG